MADLQNILDSVLETLRHGFATTNHPQGLIIALIAALLMPSWKQWLPMALLATVADIAVDRLPSVLRGQGLPNFMEQPFWTMALAYFVGNLIIIGVFFFLKSLVFKGGGKAAKAH